MFQANNASSRSLLSLPAPLQGSAPLREPAGVLGQRLVRLSAPARKQVAIMQAITEIAGTLLEPLDVATLCQARRPLVTPPPTLRSDSSPQLLPLSLT